MRVASATVMIAAASVPAGITTATIPAAVAGSVTTVLSAVVITAAVLPAVLDIVHILLDLLLVLNEAPQPLTYRVRDSRP